MSIFPEFTTRSKFTNPFRSLLRVPYRGSRVFNPFHGQNSSGNCTLYRYTVQNRAGTGPCTGTRSKIRRKWDLAPVQGPKSGGNWTLYGYKVEILPGTAPCTGTRSKIGWELGFVPVQGPVPAGFWTLYRVSPDSKPFIAFGLRAEMRFL